MQWRLLLAEPVGIASVFPVVSWAAGRPLPFKGPVWMISRAAERERAAWQVKKTLRGGYQQAAQTDHGGAR
jgi:hypothetical protein